MMPQPANPLLPDFDLAAHKDHDIQVSESERRYYYAEVQDDLSLNLYDSTSGDGESDYIVHCNDCNVEGDLGEIELDFT